MKMNAIFLVDIKFSYKARITKKKLPNTHQKERGTINSIIRVCYSVII